MASSQGPEDEAASAAFDIVSGYQDPALDAHYRMAVALGVVRGLVSALLMGAVSPVPASYVALVEKSSGAQVKRWDLSPEDYSPVSSRDALVAALRTELQESTATQIAAKYGLPSS